MTTFRVSKSESKVRDTLVSLMQQINANADLSQGQVLKDLAIDAPASEFADLYVLLDYVNAIKSLDGILIMLADTTFLTQIQEALDLTALSDVTDMIGADLDVLASNWGLTRVVATAATYTQRFYRADNPGGTIQIPVGSTVQTRDGAVIARVNASSAQSLKQDLVLGLYYVDETATAVTAGTIGNVALNSINVISPAISQATSTANVAVLSAGTDAEDNSAFAARIKGVFKQNGIDTVNGYRALMLNPPVGAQDALVAKPGDPLMLRAPAGAIDIYLVGKNLASNRETVVYRAGTTTYLLGFQPVESLTSVNDGAITAAQYGLLKDTTSLWAGSFKAQDKIQFTDVTGLVDGTTFTVEYVYDKRVNDGQGLATMNDATAVPAADVLVRQGTQATIDISVQVVTFGQRLLSDVQNDITADFGKFMSGGTTSTGATYAPKRLGEHIDFSDVIALVAAISDVDRVTTTTFVIKKNTVIQSVDPVPISTNEYARAGTVTFL